MRRISNNSPSLIIHCPFDSPLLTLTRLGEEPIHPSPIERMGVLEALISHV